MPSGKRKATTDVEKKAEKPKRAKKAEEKTFEVIDGKAQFSLLIERCTSWSIYRTGATRIQKALEQSYPEATVDIQSAGKGKKGAFEVSLIRDEKEPVVLFSKLTEFGPAKDRDHIATADAIITKLKQYFPEEVWKAFF